MSGLPHLCATTAAAAYTCMSPGVDKTPSACGDLVRSSSTFAAGLSAVNRTGMTQVRLAFSASPTSTAYLFVQSGATATLHLTWQ